MILARRGIPSPWLLAATLFGGSLAAGGANAINHYLDRDIDGAMARTRRRPVPAGKIPPRSALAFGMVLGAAGSAWLALTVNPLAASLAASAIAFYALVYTVWLKRRSAQNIVIGGAAGGVPVLVGWAAVSGRVGLPAWVLFGVVFLWTPPHFWALAIRCESDYRNAGIPMLPVVVGRDKTVRAILRYVVALVGLSLVLDPVAGMGPLYLTSALVLGVTFLWAAARLRWSPTRAQAGRLFHRSILYLGLLFLAVALDGLLRFEL